MPKPGDGAPNQSSRAWLFARDGILSALAEIRLAGLERYDAGRLLFLPVHLFCEGCEEEWGLRGIVSPFVSSGEEFELIADDGKGIFFLPSKYDGRPDSRQQFANIAACSDAPSVLVGSNARKIDLRRLRRLKVAQVWDSQMKRVGIGFELRAYLIPYLVRVLSLSHALERYESQIREKPYAVVLFDQWCDEYMFVEFCRSCGLRTATMQHGHFSGLGASGAPDANAYPFYHLNADYIFVWGDLYKGRALDCGVDESSVVVAGHPGHIGRAIPERRSSRGCFGVVLDGDSQVSMASNEVLLNSAERVCATTGLQALVRFHPNRDPGSLKLRERVGSSPSIAECPSGMGVFEFAAAIDFALAARSTVYGELLAFGVPAFRLVNRNLPDLYREVEVGMFEGEDDIVGLAARYMSDPGLLEPEFARAGEMFVPEIGSPARYLDAFRALDAGEDPGGAR